MPTRRTVLAAAVPAAAAAAVMKQETPDPIDVAGELVGRRYAEDERELMRVGLRQTRSAAEALRAAELDAGVESGLTFDPLLPGERPPAGDVVMPDLPAAGDVGSLAFATVAEQAALLRAGEITSVELTRLYLDRLKEHGPTLNCVVTLCEDHALRQAAAADARRAAGEDGPLLGIPYGAKDLFDTAGIATSYGVAIFKDRVPETNATVIDRLDAAGAVLLAKLSLGELAMNDAWFGGQTKNPWNVEEGSSGSSAGSCAAVAAGLCSFALGSETLGSIVSPSVVCGTAGLRPTFGRVPRTGAMPLARSMDKVGPVTRSVGDAAYVLAAIAGPDGVDPTCHEAGFAPHPNGGDLVVGVDEAAFGVLPAGPAGDLYRAARAMAEELFGELRPVAWPGDALLRAVAMMTVEAEAAESFEELVQAGRLGELAQQEGWNWPNTFRRAGLLPAVDYLRAQRHRRRYMREIRPALDGIDAVLTVPRLGPNLLLTNLTGHPTALCRAGLHDGRPQQIEFVGRPYGEAKLLAAAGRFEATVADRSTWPEAFA